MYPRILSSKCYERMGKPHILSTSYGSNKFTKDLLLLWGLSDWMNGTQLKTQGFIELYRAQKMSSLSIWILLLWLVQFSWTTILRHYILCEMCDFGWYNHYPLRFAHFVAYRQQSTMFFLSISYNLLVEEFVNFFSSSFKLILRSRKFLRVYSSQKLS